MILCSPWVSGVAGNKNGKYGPIYSGTKRSGTKQPDHRRVRKNNAASKRVAYESVGESRKYGSLHVKSSRAVRIKRKQDAVQVMDGQEAEPESHEDFWIGGLRPYSEAVRQEVRREVEENNSRWLPRGFVVLQVV
jgi:hypothetical protein